METVSTERLADLVDSDDEYLSVAAGAPLVVIDLTTATPAADRLAPMLGGLPCVLVGFGEDTASTPLAAALDVVTDDVGVIDTIAGNIERAPVAATALALLLRGRDARSLDESLVAESSAYSMLQGSAEFARWRASRPANPVVDPDDVVVVTRRGNTLDVLLNRPNRHNAFSMAMRDRLVEALRLALVDDEVDHVVLHGAGRSFSSGGDLDEFGSFGDAAQAHGVRLTRSAARLMARLAEHVECRLHGACMGAGIELPAFAHRLTARSDTFFALPEVAYGLVPGAGGTASLPGRIGRQRTARLGLTAERIDAPTALAWGLIDRIED
jgi:enoyl-CoA hydratase